jgi:hypothetical protein
MSAAITLTPSENYDMYKDTVDPDYRVRQIVEEESSRIASKALSINKEYDTKQRKDMLSASETARKNAYYRMFVVAAIILILTFGSVYLNSIFPLIPSSVLDLFIITIVSAGIIYLIFLYIDIMKRDKTDFHKIDFSAYLKPTEKKNYGVSTTVSGDNLFVIDGTMFNILGTSSSCIGGCCCPAGSSIFVDNKCVKKEGFFGSIEPFSVRAEYMLL